MRFVSPSFFRFVLCASVLAAAGCATGSYTYVKRTSEGERVELPLKNGSPVNAKLGTIEIAQSGLMPNRDKTLKDARYVFAFRDTSNVAPKAVRIEDVTDETTHFIMEDLAPVLKDSIWVGTSRGFVTGDPEVQWLNYLDNTIRIYRFTITRPDGTKIFLHQGWSVPGWLKPAIRQSMGETIK